MSRPCSAPGQSLTEALEQAGHRVIQSDRNLFLRCNLSIVDAQLIPLRVTSGDERSHLSRNALTATIAIVGCGQSMRRDSEAIGTLASVIEPKDSLHVHPRYNDSICKEISMLTRALTFIFTVAAAVAGQFSQLRAQDTPQPAELTGLQIAALRDYQ
jgi:hypothetical protein